MLLSVLVPGQEQDNAPSKYKGEVEQLGRLEQEATLLQVASELENRRLAILEMAKTQGRAQAALEKAIALHKKQAEELAASREAVAAAEAKVVTAEAKLRAAQGERLEERAEATQKAVEVLKARQKAMEDLKAAEAKCEEAQAQLAAEKSRASELELALGLERVTTETQKEKIKNLGLAVAALTALCLILAGCLVWRRR